MAQLILDWLNDDVKLSRRVESLAEDFQDGTLLGELLFLHNQQDNFDKFIFKANADAKINNFCLLETSMKRLGLTFNSKTAFDVMNGNIGVIRTLLYEIKTAVEMIAKTSKPVLVKNGDGVLEEKLPRVIPGPKAVFDKSMSQTFENCVRMYMENPTDILIEEATKRFKDKELDFLRTVATQSDSAEMDFKEDLQRRKNIEKQRKRQEKEFKEAWDAMNVGQWKKNQTTAKERKAVKERVDSFLMSKRDAAILRMRTEARDSALNGIDEFEEKLRTEIFPVDPDLQETVGKAIQSFGGGDDTDVPGLTTLNEKYLNDGLTHAQKKLKEHHEDLLELQKMHNRRRLKFFTEEEGLHMSNLRHQAEGEIVAQLMNLSQPEITNNEARKTIFCTVPIAQQNVVFRDSLIAELNAQALVFRGKMEREKARRELDWVVGSRIDAQIDILRNSILAERTSKQQQSLETVQEVLEKYLDFVDWICWTREVGNLRTKPVTEVVLPSILLEDALKCFVEELPFPPSIPCPIQLNSSNVLPHSLISKPVFSDAGWLFNRVFSAKDVFAYSYPCDASNADNTVVDFLANSDLKNFVSEITQCVSSEIVEVGPGLVHPVSEADMSLPPDWLVTTPPDNLLGETIVALRCAVDPVPQDPEPILIIPENYLRLCIFGSSDTARRALSDRLNADYGVHVVVVEKLLHSAIEIAVKLSTLESNEFSSQEVIYQRIYSLVSRGASLSDELYVALLGFYIRSLVEREDYKGFVVEDFPRTKNQAVLLLQELSGIDYSRKKPHRSDRLSMYTTPAAFDESLFDPAKCGIDGVVMISTEPSVVISQKISYRKDLITGEMVYISSATDNVSVLAEDYAPLNTLQVIGTTAKTSSDCAADISPFLSKLSLLKVYSAVNYENEQSMATVISQEISELYPGKENYKKNNTFVEESSDPIINEIQTAIDGEAVNTEAAAVDPEDPPCNEATIDAIPVAPELRRTSVPLQLASSLCDIWGSTEKASISVSSNTFLGLRDIRYQMVQRCRNAADFVCSSIICKDGKQYVFEAFRKDFNLVPEDLRFDPDMITELHLRTLEMRAKLSDITDKRRKDVQERLASIASDGALAVLSHRSRCEAASLVQTELNRFIASCHTLLDTSKALCKFKNSSKVANELEETLPIGEIGGEKVDAKGGKDAKGKAPAKGKGAEIVITPYRDPVAPVILNMDAMASIPKPASAAAAVAVDPKAKDGKGKKGEAETVPADPFSLAEKAATDYFNTYSAGTYTINRSLYAFSEGVVDPVVESVCSSVEKAIWCEAARSLRTIVIIRRILQTHVEWLESTEAAILKYLEEVIASQWQKEVAADERLVTMIQGRIEESEPIRDLWKICADAISVECNKLVVADPLPHPVPRINQFFMSHFNEEQLVLISAAMRNLALGGHVLEEDINSLVDLFSSSGTLGCHQSEMNMKIDDGEMTRISVINKNVNIPEGLLLPEAENKDSIIKECLNYGGKSQRIGYIEEHTGIVPVDAICDRLYSKAKKKRQVRFDV